MFQIIRAGAIPFKNIVFKLPKILIDDPFIQMSDASHGDVIVFNEKYYVVFDERIE